MAKLNGKCAKMNSYLLRCAPVGLYSLRRNSQNVELDKISRGELTPSLETFRRVGRGREWTGRNSINDWRSCYQWPTESDDLISSTNWVQTQKKRRADLRRSILRPDNWLVSASARPLPFLYLHPTFQNSALLCVYLHSLALGPDRMTIFPLGGSVVNAIWRPGPATTDDSRALCMATTELICNTRFDYNRHTHSTLEISISIFNFVWNNGLLFL